MQLQQAKSTHCHRENDHCQHMWNAEQVSDLQHTWQDKDATTAAVSCPLLVLH